MGSVCLQNAFGLLAVAGGKGFKETRQLGVGGSEV